ncbi:MAG: amidohydrolase family protein [Armatimonadetes bacterium]|nr:amidohydrolase family protein [Armatimonadota bacterium]
MPLIDSFAILGPAAPVPGDFGREELLRRMDELEITHAIVISALAMDCDFEVGNAWLAKEIENERRLLGYAVVNTNHPPQAIEDMRRYMSRKNFVGMMLVQGNGNTPVSNADSEEILNAYRRYGKPLLISAPNRECVYAASALAAKFDQMKFVLMGMGGEDWRSAISAATAYLNIYLSTTGEISPDKVRQAWPAVNGHRILFGSGAPLVDPAIVLGMIEEVELAGREKDLLLQGNAYRTFAG